MTISITGMVSGLDTESLIKALTAAESAQVTLLQNRQAKDKQKSNAIAQIETLMSEVQTSVSTLRGEASIRKFTTASSNSTVATASATGEATASAHSVVVNQLAAAMNMIHTAGTTAGTSAIGVTFSEAVNANLVSSTSAAWFTVGTSGATYDFQFGSEGSFTVTFAAGSSYSMADAASLINAASLAVSTYNAATVTYDSQTGQYYLDMTAKNSYTTGVMSLTLSSGEAIDVFSDASDWYKVAATAGQFSYTYGTGSAAVTRTISLAAGGTLTDLKNAINYDSGNPGVIANIVESGGTYHLSLTGKNTGATNTITINNPATILSGFESTDFTVAQNAQDAQVRVDGYPPATWTSRSSNSISDIITGVTLNLQGTGTTNISLTRDSTQLSSDLADLVKAYNNLQYVVNYATDYDPNTGDTGILEGDSAILNAVAQIRDSLIGTPPGFSSDDTYSVPAQVGLIFDLDSDYQGSLVFDTDTFDNAVATNYDAVVRLIGALGSGVSNSSKLIFDSAISSTSAGIYDVQATFDSSGNVSMARIKLSTEDESAWRYMEVSEGNMLTGKSGNPEQGLAIHAVYGGSALETAQVRLRDGVAKTTYNTISDLLSIVDGTVTLDKNRYDDDYASLAEQIETQQERIEKRIKVLRTQFANLEAQLEQIKTWQSQYAAMLQQIGSTSSSILPNTGTLNILNSYSNNTLSNLVSSDSTSLNSSTSSYSSSNVTASNS